MQHCRHWRCTLAATVLKGASEQITFPSLIFLREPKQKAAVLAVIRLVRKRRPLFPHQDPAIIF